MKSEKSNLIQACTALTYKLQMMTMPSYAEQWRKMSVLSNSKKKEIEDYRRNKGYDSKR